MSQDVGAGRIVIAEAIGTSILMLGGPGVAIIGVGGSTGGQLAVALGFGFALLIATYSIGHVSGCHINPAVTVGMWLMRRIETRRVAPYIVGQVIGAVVGAGVIWVVRRGAADAFRADEANFATNLWDADHGFYGFWPMVVAEVVLTGILVFVTLSATRRDSSPSAVGLQLGVTLALIHMIAIPIDNGAVNPARSLGTALFGGGAALEQLWAFVVFPIIGSGLGAMWWMAVDERVVAVADGAFADQVEAELSDEPTEPTQPTEPTEPTESTDDSDADTATTTEPHEPPAS